MVPEQLQDVFAVLYSESHQILFRVYRVMKDDQRPLRNSCKLSKREWLAIGLGAGVLAWSSNTGKPATVKCYVLDSACAFTKSLKKPISAECATVCA